MYTQIEKRLELVELLLEVRENPTENRVIVTTHLPNLAEPWEEDSDLNYMIDKSDGGSASVRNEDGTLTEVKPAEVFDCWHVSDSAGNGAEFPTASDVLNFFDLLAARTPIEAHVESF